MAFKVNTYCKPFKCYFSYSCAAFHTLATNCYLLCIKAPRAVAHPVSANPSPGRAHDPSWGIWPYTVLKSRTTCEQLPVLSRSPRKEIMMSRSRQEPDLFNSTRTRHVTKLSFYGFRYVSVLLYEFCRNRKKNKLKSCWSCLNGEIIATTKNFAKYLKPRIREMYFSCIFRAIMYAVMNFMI